MHDIVLENCVLCVMELSLVYPAEPRSSSLVFGHHLDIAHEIRKALPSQNMRLAIIADENVASLARKTGLDAELFCFPAGEPSKTRATKEALEDALLAAGFGRDTAIIGFGGGITTDLAGFVAATFCRGVPFITVPTTLMGMVDASIGGKTGVNTSLAKNMIGAFYPAMSVIIDTDFLTMLPEEHYREGLAEIVKYALIASPELFSTLLHQRSSWLQRDPAFLGTLIYQSCTIKADIVQKDPWEKGLRRVLNFGHTIGHALEIASSHRLSHGSAVAIGMMMESRLSHLLGSLSLEDLKKIEHLYSLYDLPATPFFSCALPTFINALQLDKKRACGQVRVVTLDRIGCASSHGGHYCTPFDLDQLFSLLHTEAMA